jgi:hypothetical protein
MNFLDRLRTPSFGVNGNSAYAYTPVGREDLDAMRPYIERAGPDPAPVNIPMPQNYGGRGMFGPAQRGNEFGPQGIQNTTGFSQEAPNVVYDQRPEQFEKELKLKKRQLDINEKQVDYLGGLKGYDAETRRMNAETALDRNSIARFRAENPNAVIKMLPGGNVVAIDPQTNQVTDLGYSSGLMDDRSKITLQQQGKETLAGVNNAAAQTRAETMATAMGERTAANNQNDLTEIVMRAVAAATGKGSETPSLSDQAARAAQFINENPWAREFVHISPDGKGVVIDAPRPEEGSGQTGNAGDGGTMFDKLKNALGRKTQGPTNDQWRQINTGVYQPRVDVIREKLLHPL